VITTRSIFLFLFATGGVVALLAFGWKFGVEEWLDPFLPGEHAADSIAERWEFVIASTFFAIAATAPPSLFVGRLLRERMTADRLSAAVFDSAPQPMLVTDHERTILAINPAFEEMSGWSRADLVGCPASTLRSGDHPDEFYKSISHALDTTGAWTGEVTNRRQDGSPYAAALAITGVRDERGIVIEFIGVLTDITWRKQREEQALFDATHDPLTGLANRRLLMVRLRQVIAASTVSAEQLREGKHAFRDGETDGPLVEPVIDYGRDLGVSVTGGYVYRGAEFPSLQGVYIYADYGFGRMWGLRHKDGTLLANREILPADERKHVSSFGEGPDGELYVCAFDQADRPRGKGRLFRIVVRE
jgi:PAS domain S-box-containing protein